MRTTEELDATGEALRARIAALRKHMDARVSAATGSGGAIGRRDPAGDAAEVPGAGASAGGRASCSSAAAPAAGKAAAGRPNIFEGLITRLDVADSDRAGPVDIGDAVYGDEEEAHAALTLQYAAVGADGLTPSDRAAGEGSGAVGGSLLSVGAGGALAGGGGDGAVRSAGEGIAAARRAKLAAMGDSAAADGAGAVHLAPSAASKVASSSEPGDSSGGDDSMPAGLEAVLAQQQAMMAKRLAAARGPGAPVMALPTVAEAPNGGGAGGGSAGAGACAETLAGGSGTDTGGGAHRGRLSDARTFSLRTTDGSVATPRTPRTLAQKVLTDAPSAGASEGAEASDAADGVDVDVTDSDGGSILFTDNGQQASADVCSASVGTGGRPSFGGSSTSRPSSAAARRGPPAAGEAAGYSAFKLPGSDAAPSAASCKDGAAGSRPGSALRTMTPRGGALPPSRGASARGMRPGFRGGATPRDENALAGNSDPANGSAPFVCSASG